jgi:hypothetical protein
MVVHTVIPAMQEVIGKRIMVWDQGKKGETLTEK